MPLTTSLSLIRPTSSVTRFPTSPYQFACIAILVVGCEMTAGVHSTVCIFARTAALMRRARWNRSSSFQDGYSTLSLSQIALCSSTNSRDNMLRPTHQPGTWLGSVWRSLVRGSKLFGPMCSLPSVPDLTFSWCSGLVPYSDDPSHQCVSVLTKVGGCPSAASGRVGSGG